LKDTVQSGAYGKLTPDRSARQGGGTLFASSELHEAPSWASYTASEPNAPANPSVNAARHDRRDRRRAFLSRGWSLSLRAAPLPAILASVRGLEFPNTLVVTIDKERVHAANFGGRDDQERSNEENAYAVADEIDARLKFERHVTAGPHAVAVTFLRKPLAQSADLWKEYERRLIDSNEDKGLPHLDQVDITGPLTISGVGDTPSRRKIFTCRPEGDVDERLCAAEILSSLARRAYRRPVSEAEVTELLGFFDQGRAAGSFDP